MTVAPKMNEAANHFDGCVLVAEDEFLVALELEAILRDAGIERIKVCRTVGDALAQARGANFVAAILDVQLGEERVSPVARQLARRGIPFLFYTAHPETDPLLSEWQGRQVIAKPADAGTIRHAVAALLHH
jgi:DNA-binding response OmpR family regulator